MWKLADKYKECCHNESCDSFDTCIECWDEWAERNPPMTNADRIRAMSDEMLAMFLRCWDSRSKLCEDRVKVFFCNYECIDCVAEWLKQPAEEVHHE